MKKETTKEVTKLSSRISKYVSAICTAVLNCVSARNAVMAACKGLKGEDDYKALRPHLVKLLTAKGLSAGTIKGYCVLVRECCGIPKQQTGNKNPVTKQKAEARKAIAETEKMLSAKQAGVKHQIESEDNLLNLAGSDRVLKATRLLCHIFESLNGAELKLSIETALKKGGAKDKILLSVGNLVIKK